MFPWQSDGERAVHEETMTSESAITVWSPGVCWCWYTRPVTVWSKHILAAARQRVNIGDLQVVWDSTLGIFRVHEETHNTQRRDHKQYARRVGGQANFYPILFNSILNSIIIKVQNIQKNTNRILKQWVRCLNVEKSDYVRFYWKLTATTILARLDHK